MEKQEVIDILTQFNKWRRGDLEEYPVAPSVLGVAIEWAIKYLEKKDDGLSISEVQPSNE